MSLKIIEVPEVGFKVKELDVNGNSVKVFDESFDTHEAASEFIKQLESTASGIQYPVDSVKSDEEVFNQEVVGEANSPEGEGTNLAEKKPEEVEDLDPVEDTEEEA